MDALALTQLLTRTAAMYRTKLTDLEMDVYLDELEPLDDLTVREAFARYRGGGRSFFPTIPELFQAIEQMAIGRGAVVDGASAWDALERELFGCWSETNDRINVRVHGYPWPNDRCKAILRGELNCTVRDVAEMHPKGVADLRARFVGIYDGVAQVEQAEQTVARLAPPETVPIPIPPRPQRPRLVGGEEQ